MKIRDLQRHYGTIIFLLLSCLFVLLRYRHIGHILMWDEAWNIMSLRTYLAGRTDSPYLWYYFFHPPLYMVFARMLFPLAEGFAERLCGLSLVFSYMTFVAVYLLAREIADRTYARLSVFLLSVIPASIAYDTWIKRDTLASFFGYLSLYFLYRKKHVWSALLLGLSLLSKETGLFFCTAYFLLVLVSGEKSRFRNIVRTSVIIFIMTAWWYGPLSTFTEKIFSFYFSSATRSSLHTGNSFLYYSRKSLYDLGIPVLLLTLSGVIWTAYKWIFKKEKKWLYILSVPAIVYTLLSFVISSKAPWQVITALPGAAMLAGAGLYFLITFPAHRYLLRPLAGIMTVLCLFQATTFSYEVFHKKTYPNGWPGAMASYKLAEYLNSAAETGARVLIPGFAYWKRPTCPVFTYYLKDRQIVITDSNFKSEALSPLIEQYDVSWIALPYDPDRMYTTGMKVREINRLTGKEPVKAGWSFVWELK